MAITLRKYQETIKAKVYNDWEIGHNNVLLVMPTGAGKTKTFCSIAIDYSVKPHNKVHTAIMVHRKELVQQISLTLAEEGVLHNIIAQKKTTMGIIAGHRKMFGKSFYDANGMVTVVSVDTLNSRFLRYQAWVKKVKLWITDEAAHLLKDNKWGRAAALFINARGLGVTATPQRLDKKGLGSHVDGVFDSMVEGPNTRYLINNGFLCKYKVAVPEGDYENYLKRAGNNADFTKKAMAQASKESRIVGDVVENHIKWANGKQTILFATDINTAQDMEAKFNEAGIPAKLLTGETSDQERLEGMVEFRSKKITVLLNVDLFDEGLDVPGIECVQMARPTMSLGKFLQMCGRGLRVDGDKHLILIDHVGNVNRHQLPDKPRIWTLDRQVRRRRQMDLMRQCLNPTCMSPYDRELTECPWCGTIPMVVETSGGRVGPEQVDGDLYLIDPFTLEAMEKDVLLESPEDMAKRVSMSSGGMPAAVQAMRRQQERIETQQKLGERIADWAGMLKARGYKDREIHKIYFLDFGETISQSLSKPKADMNKLMEELG